MPHITVAVEDRLYRAARIYAAQYEITLTEIVREFLTDIVPANCYMDDGSATSPVQERERRRHVVRERRLERGYPHPPPHTGTVWKTAWPKTSSSSLRQTG